MYFSVIGLKSLRIFDILFEKNCENLTANSLFENEVGKTVSFLPCRTVLHMFQNFLESFEFSIMSSDV